MKPLGEDNNMKKKVNPRRIPISRADVDREVKKVCTIAIQQCMAIIFNVLVDKHNYSVEQLQELWNEVNYLSDSIDKGYVNVSDILYMLKQEYGINIEGFKT